jgi:hypothetical protein
LLLFGGMAFLALAAIPWLQGFFAPEASTEAGTAEVLAELGEWGEADGSCISASYGGLSLTADVSPTVPGEERILASFTQGVVVLDAEDHIVARTPGFDCEGSEDELVALAVGDAGAGEPFVALAATTGGHNETMTWLTLYRVANSGELQPVFIGEVERHVGDTTRTGVVTLVPGGLVYRPPSGAPSVWTYDAELGRYVEALTPMRPNA